MLNYISQVNWFWTLDAEHAFNGNETRLYFWLLSLSNALNWKNPLTNADAHTASMVRISINTLKTCRDRLEEAGLIQFTPGGNGARDKCIYRIIEAGNKVSKNDTLRDEIRYQNLTPSENKVSDKVSGKVSDKVSRSDTINKQKLNRNNSASIEAVQKNKVSKNDTLPQKVKTEYWQTMVDTWFEFYKNEFAIAPSFEGAATKALKSILKRLKKISLDAGKEWTETYAKKVLNHFLSRAISDKWRRENFMLHTLSLHFDAIIKKPAAKVPEAEQQDDEYMLNRRRQEERTKELTKR